MRVVAAAGGVLVFAALTAAAAWVRLPLPGTPVPVTLQTLVVLLSGFALGPTLGTASQALYLASGLAGMPVFSGGQGGLTVLAGPTGGYLLGFAVAAWLAGWISRRGEGRFRALALGGAAGLLAVYGLGLSWLVFVYGFSVAEAAAAGLVPFLPWALAKTLVAIGAGRAVWPVARRLWPGSVPRPSSATPANDMR